MRNFLWLLPVLLELWEPLKPSVAASNVVTDEQPCRARAWVRAPDLEAGQVIQGEVRVKLDGTCDDVSSYSLRLRFAERAWVKTRRVGVQLPERPVANNTYTRPTYSNSTVFDIDDIWMQDFAVDPSAWEKYHSNVKDPELWLAREEERIGFEIKYDLCAEKKLKNHVVEPFAILVPSTAYPPAFDTWGTASSSSSGVDDAGSEHIYMYFVDIAFVNGTNREISAGFTSFNGGGKPTPPAGPETVNVTATGHSYLKGKDGMMYPEVPEDIFTLGVTFPHGRYLEQGSLNNITIVSHQLGPGLGRPERLDWLHLQNIQKRHWAASHAADNATANTLLTIGWTHSSQLRPTNPLVDGSRLSRLSSRQTYKDEEWCFSQDGIVENGRPFSTNAITAQFEVPEDFYPYFEMHYQTAEAKLKMTLMVRNTSLPEESESEDPEDYDWIPSQRASALPLHTLLSASIPIFVRPKLDKWVSSAPISEGDHYLSPEALAPVFVSPSSVNQLLQKSPADRDTLAPKVQPKFVTHTGADVSKSRYHPAFPSTADSHHYVGNTWLRKVVSRKKDSEADVQTGGLVIQS